MYLWNKTTGDLYLWTSLSYDLASGVLSYTSHQIASNWNTGTAVTLQAADINGDHAPDLWSTDSTGNVTAHLLATDASSFNATPPTDKLATLSHIWDLDEQSSGTVTAGSAGDQVGSLPLSASATTGAVWGTGDLFSPALSLNTGVANTTATLTTTGAALNLSGDFSISLWAKPNALGGNVLSQNGAHTAGITLYPDKTTGDWYVCMATADNATTPAADCVRGVPVDVGAWAHLAVTYDHTNGRLALYVNGVESNLGTHTVDALTLFRGNLTIGDKDAAAHYYDGTLSQLQTWAQILTPNQIAGVIDQPNFIAFPSDNTQYPTGSTWTRGAAVMSFNQGQLNITVAGTTMYTKGTATSPNAVLVLQSDGNLVAYPTAANATAGTSALWGTGTNYGAAACCSSRPTATSSTTPLTAPPYGTPPPASPTPTSGS